MAETEVRERYLRRDHDGTMAAESPPELLERVGSAIAKNREFYDEPLL